MNDNPYKYFMIEADELLESLDREILEFEKDPKNQDLLNRLFRYAHTLKGAAHVVGLLKISKLAHVIEDLFSATRDKGLSLTKDQISLIIDTIHVIRTIKDTIQAGDSEDAKNIEAVLERFVSENDKSANAPEPLKNPLDTKESLKSLVSEKSKNGDVPKLEANDKIKLSEAAGKSAVQKEKGSPSSTLAETIRVALADVDSVMDQSSELITGAIRLEQIHTNLKSELKSLSKISLELKKVNTLTADSTVPGIFQNIKAVQDAFLKDTSALDLLIEEFKQSTESIYQVVNKIRSMRVDDISHYFKGIVRDLSVKLDKKIELKIKGNDTELDRNLLQELKEPVNQLMRNAAVHGIEDEADRLNKGKKPEGLIELEIKKNGEFIHITCRDDGRGIDAYEIKQIAFKKGIIDENRFKELTEKESLRYLFHSGISSGKIITELAGRGVGLDIVKNKVESLRGQIIIETKIDEFTAFSMKVPLSMNMINAFLIETSGRHFLIPLNLVIETGYTNLDQIDYLAGKAIVNINEQPVTLIQLCNILEISNDSQHNSSTPYIVLKSEDQSAAFSVDKIMGIHKIIIKDLGEELRDSPFFIGGSILSNGQPATILNVAHLFKMSTNQTTGSYASDSDPETDLSKPAYRILAVDDSLTSRVLIGGILEAEGYDVTLATSGEDALNILSANQYDLIISDVEMPGINGFELSSRIRHDPEHKETPIMIISSLAKDEHKRKGIEAGVQAYIIKGAFNQQVFLETIERLI
ncbi:MAG: response regulator [Desulfobacteraceae bacterium]|nr:response regulator [Desulfobacteraceae bacterium]